MKQSPRIRLKVDGKTVRRVRPELRRRAYTIGTPYDATKEWRENISEAVFTKQVIDLARWNNWLCAHFRPAMTKRGRWVTAVQGDGAGFPDIIALRGNRRIMAELKSIKGGVTTEQHKWLESARKANFEVYIWRPKDINEIEVILK